MYIQSQTIEAYGCQVTQYSLETVSFLMRGKIIITYHGKSKNYQSDHWLTHEELEHYALQYLHEMEKEQKGVSIN